jgi:nitrite reductase/ring-hydroxylating ferredoxin subunit/uncharacterized membrane protein
MNTQSDPIAKALQGQDWLEPVEQTLKKGLDGVFQPDTARGKPVENALHGVWLGHPLHPVLTDIPLGAWSITFILDLIEDVSGDRKYQAGAAASLTVGLGGAAAAAATGLTDWKEIDQDARRTGLVHGLLNTVALSLYVTSAVQRARGKRGSAKAFSYLAYGVAMGSAWLGGHLVFTNQIGVARAPLQEPPPDFVPVLPLDQLEESKPRKVEHNGYPLLLVRKGQKVYALTETCTHAGGPLSEGKLQDGCIRCPWHGSLFSLENGEVKEGPAVHPEIAFETRVSGNQIEVRMRKSVNDQKRMERIGPEQSTAPARAGS